MYEMSIIYEAVVGPSYLYNGSTSTGPLYSYGKGLIEFMQEY